MFNSAQIEILDIMSRVREQSDITAIRDMISNYFAEKAEREIEEQWETGKLNAATIESWKNEHMRTAYQQ